MINSLKFRLQRNLINSLGRKTKRKILVIESDDWGAIRMPNRKVHEALLNKGVVQENDAFARYDGLESTEDLEFLFETLSKFKDIHHNPAVLTANVILANPDFKAIKESEFKKYTFEDANTTSLEQRGFLLREKWNEGLNQGVFYPQLHGREHVNVNRWLDKLQKDDILLRSAFELGTFVGNNNLDAAFNSFTLEDDIYYAEVIKDAVDLFHNNFGFYSKTFIAPHYTWPKALEEVLKMHNIFYLQGSKWQNIPLHDTDQVKKEFHYFAQKSKSGVNYLTRNCLFEPSISPNVDYVSACLKHVHNAFYWNNPAIIVSHRLNYVSVGGKVARDKNLKNLALLLRLVQKRWPDVEFLNTEQLSEEMENKTF